MSLFHSLLNPSFCSIPCHSVCGGSGLSCSRGYVADDPSKGRDQSMGKQGVRRMKPTMLSLPRSCPRLHSIYLSHFHCPAGISKECRRRALWIAGYGIGLLDGLVEHFPSPYLATRLTVYSTKHPFNNLPRHRI